MYQTSPETKKSELRIQKKIILNKNKPSKVEVAIGEIEIFHTKENNQTQTHYTISFGADKNITIIGKEEWRKFLSMLQWLDWNPNDTQEIYMDDRDTIVSVPSFSQTITAETEYCFFEDQNGIIDGIPIYDE